MMKVNAIKKISCAILCALIMAGAVLVPVTAQAQDESFGKRHQKKELAEGEFAVCARKLPLNKVFDNVERVLILVIFFQTLQEMGATKNLCRSL